jgi:hypothetical protein
MFFYMSMVMVDDMNWALDPFPFKNTYIAYPSPIHIPDVLVSCFDHVPFRSLSSLPFIGVQEIKLIAIPVLAD